MLLNNKYIENAHSKKIEHIEKLLNTNIEKGLNSAIVDNLLSFYGINQIETNKSESLFKLFFNQINQPLIYILIFSSIVTSFMKEWIDTLVIIGVVIINAIIGFLQEYKAIKALESLTTSMNTETTVIRDGNKLRISSKNLIPGDIVFLESGDKVPADIRIFRSFQLKSEEAALTGESIPVEKNTDTIDEKTLLADRKNMLYASTYITHGQGYGIVVSTGMNTEIGKISSLLKNTSAVEAPLVKKIDKFSKFLVYIIVIMAALNFTVGFYRGENWLYMLKASIALAVGAIPEGLPAALTATLAIGVSRMAKINAIIRKLPVVETLGSTTVICSDKTGTLTENKMTVKEIRTTKNQYEVTGQGYNKEGRITLQGKDIDVNDDYALLQTLVCGIICNDSNITVSDNSPDIIHGDPTEISLLLSAYKAGISKDNILAENKKVDVLPFESERQYMAVASKDRNNKTTVYIKGSIEKILEICNYELDEKGNKDKINKKDLIEKHNNLVQKGLRVLAFAYKEIPNKAFDFLDTINNKGFVFTGLQGMIDPPRTEAIKAVETCKNAGIIVKMITGDHALTAFAIAKQIGIVDTNTNNIKVFTGKELQEMDDDSLRNIVVDNNIYARVSPEQKLRLVKAIQSHGNIVAMTGDGVNDAPALKRADIGIAMGITGTEVAKDASDMIIMDDNFATIEAAIEEGRGVFDNITKFITWTLPTNLGEGLLILFAVFLGVTLPITPLQILWINMTTAVFLGLPLAFEPKDISVMARKPRDPKQPILTKNLIIRILIIGICLLLASFGLFEYYLSEGVSIDEARTIAVTVFIVIEAAVVWNCRTLEKSSLRINMFSNKFIWIGLIIMAILQLSFIYLPFMNYAFKTAAISLKTWLVIISTGVITFLIVEIEKYITTRFLIINNKAMN